jgi:hypothetical protein
LSGGREFGRNNAGKEFRWHQAPNNLFLSRI